MPITVMLNPALSIGDHWAAHPDLLRMLCYAVVVSIGDILAVTMVAQCSWVDFVYHWVVQQRVAIVHYVYLAGGRAGDLLHRHLRVLMVALAREEPCHYSSWRYYRARIIIDWLHYVLDPLADTWSILLAQGLLLLVLLYCVVHTGLVNWIGGSPLQVIPTRLDIGDLHGVLNARLIVGIGVRWWIWWLVY